MDVSQGLPVFGTMTLGKALQDRNEIVGREDNTSEVLIKEAVSFED